MSAKKKRKNNSGFTLIELLIVIGLLGALTALILPRLMADREEALGDVCDYNQAGTLRVLNQYHDMYGNFPVDMHNGLKTTASGATAMDGLPDAQSLNMLTNAATTVVALTTNEAASLIAAGITKVCSGTGLNETDVAAGVYVARCTTSWQDDTPTNYTFNGISIADWESHSGTPSWDENDGRVFVFWIAPTTDWSAQAGDGGNNDWTKGNVEYGISLAGQCPIPVKGTSGGDADFAFYMAYFKAYSDLDGSGDTIEARLLGTSCPECGVMNP